VSMFSGQAQLHHVDNDRYGVHAWTTVRDMLARIWRASPRLFPPTVSRLAPQCPTAFLEFPEAPVPTSCSPASFRPHFTFNTWGTHAITVTVNAARIAIEVVEAAEPAEMGC
jgi:hypothetical protein